MSILPKVNEIVLRFFCGPQRPIFLRSISGTNFSIQTRLPTFCSLWIQTFRFAKFLTNPSGSLLRRSVGGGGVSLGFLSFFESEEDKLPVEERIVTHIKKSILYAERQEYAAAERELYYAFVLSKQHGFEDVLSQVTSYQANLALKVGNLAKAEDLFKFLTQRLVNLRQATTTDNTFIEISLKLSEIYAKTGRTDEALTGFQYCVIAQRQKIDAGAEDEDTLMLGAWALHNLSQTYIRLGTPVHLAKAVFCLTKADAYVTKAVGADAQQAISIKSDLATALALKGDHAAAFKIFAEIEEVAKEKYGDLYAGIRVNVGNMHLQRSEFDEASRVCSEAKDLASKFKNMDAFHRAEECMTKSVGAGKSAASSSSIGSQPLPA